MNLSRVSLSTVEQVARAHGLVLSEEQCREIIEAEDAYLSESGRVSFGESATTRVIREFETSPYILNESAFEAILELTEAFYELREEFPASVTDVDIIELLRGSYNGDAAGDVGLAVMLARELLSGTYSVDEYEIADDEGNVYRWNPDEWHEDVMVDGWYGERWEEADEWPSE